MAAPAGTIVLNSSCVLVEGTTSAITTIGTAIVCLILQIGDGVTYWSEGDTVVIHGNTGVSFKYGSSTYTVVNQDDILFSYESPA